MEIQGALGLSHPLVYKRYSFGNRINICLTYIGSQMIPAANYGNMHASLKSLFSVANTVIFDVSFYYFLLQMIYTYTKKVVYFLTRYLTLST